MNDPVQLREFIREVLAMRPRDKFTERQHFEGVRRRCPGDSLTVDEFQEAREWNHSRNYIDFERDDDLDADVWFLTPKGKAKEGVK